MPRFGYSTVCATCPAFGFPGDPASELKVVMKKQSLAAGKAVTFRTINLDPRGYSMLPEMGQAPTRKAESSRPFKGMLLPGLEMELQTWEESPRPSLGARTGALTGKPHHPGS